MVGCRLTLVLILLLRFASCSVLEWLLRVNRLRLDLLFSLDGLWLCLRFAVWATAGGRIESAYPAQSIQLFLISHCRLTWTGRRTPSSSPPSSVLNGSRSDLHFVVVTAGVFCPVYRERCLRFLKPRLQLPGSWRCYLKGSASRCHSSESLCRPLMLKGACFCCSVASQRLSVLVVRSS